MKHAFLKVKSKILRHIFRFTVLVVLMIAFYGCDFSEYFKLRKLSSERQKELKVKMDSLQHEYDSIDKEIKRIEQVMKLKSELDSSNSLRISSDTIVTTHN